MARKYGPTRGEYVFRLCSGLIILGLLAVLLFSKGAPQGISASESILFGGVFGLFLVVQAVWRLYKRDYREP